MTKWYIKARSNSTLLLADTAIEQSFENLHLIKKFNDVGTWALQLRREDPHVQTFMPVLTSGKYGYPNGIIVQVDNEDGNGLQTILSGPQLDIDVKSNQDNTQPVLITGACDNYWLKKRLALQVPDFPYAGYVGAYFAGGGAPPYHYIAPFPLRYYQLKEPSGTTATDTMAAANGTYHGTVTYNQPGLIDDPSTCIKFDGSTTYISAPSTGLPTAANAPVYFGCWIMFSANPASTRFIMCIGDRDVAGHLIALELLSTGLAQLSTASVVVTSLAALSLNTPHFVFGAFDGSKLYLYVDGVLQNTGGTSASLTLSYSGATPFAIGAQTSGSLGAVPANFFNGWIGHATFATNAYAISDVQNIYAVGVSRQAYLAYDTRPTPTNPGKASTVIYQYVLNNAGSSALPATTFTNAIGTQTARQVPNISLAADPLIGSNVTGLARSDILLYLIAATALQSNPELFFKLEQSGTNLVFTISQPPDLTSTAIFSRDFYGAKGNILDYEWKLSAATANHLLVGGSNPAGGSANLTDRLFAVGEDASSISANGYLEDFLDYRQGNNSTTLAQAITGQLAQDASILNINATLLDQPGVLYLKGPAGKGYDLGGKVRVLVDGFAFDQIIRQIQIDLQPGQPAIITPAIGTPVAAEITSEYDIIARRLQSLQYQSNTLSSNY